MILFPPYCMIEQVCLDYWNSLVLELFEAHHNIDNPAVAAANMMGLQVLMICSDDFVCPFGIRGILLENLEKLS